MGRERRASGVRFIGKQTIYLTADDLLAFSDALRAEFPGVRFIDAHDSDLNVDWEATRNDPDREAKERLFAGLPSPVIAKPRDEWRLYEYDSLAAFREPNICQSFDIVFADPGWAPIWEESLTGWPWIVNWPKHGITFHRPVFKLQWGGLHNALPAEPRGTRIIQLRDGGMSGSYYPGEDAWLKRLRRVFRIFTKLTTNKVCGVDLQTGEISQVYDRDSFFWVGHHALDWAREHPCNFIDTYLKPIDWVPPTPEELARLGVTLPLVPPPESAFAHQRRREARMRENARRRKEAQEARTKGDQ